MRAVVIVTLCVAALGVSLHSAQAANGDALQPVELALIAFGEGFDQILQGFETQLLTLIYQEDAADVQAQVDACEVQFWSTEEAEVEEMTASLYLLSSACTSEDPYLPVNQLIQNILTLFTTVTEGCDSLSVDLVGDTNDFIATALQQGYVFSGQWRPLTEFAARSLEVATWSDLDPVYNAVEDLLMTLGITREALDASATDADDIEAALISATSEIPDTGVPSVEELSELLGATERLASDGVIDLSEALQGIAELFRPVVQSSCLFFRPILGVVAPVNQ